jgi:hypothetical protein
MSQELMSLISTGGAGVAVTVVTLVFLRFLRVERKELMSDRQEERRQFLQRLDDISHRLELLAENVKDAFCLGKAIKRRDGGEANDGGRVRGDE